jgi:hypothetical protein
MGLLKEALFFYEVIHKEKYLDFSKKIKVVELGSQNVIFDDIDFSKKIITSLNLNEGIVTNFYFNMSSRYMHELMGNDYDCVDLDIIDDKALRWDINTINCPPKYKGVYDLCTNAGTTEHLINQYNAFKLVHDLTRPGGIMIHSLPLIQPNHGFFSYSPNFFSYLSKYNNYKMIKMYTSSLPYEDGFNTLTENLDISISLSYIHVIMQKINDNDFITPLQIYLKGDKNE